MLDSVNHLFAISRDSKRFSACDPSAKGRRELKKIPHVMNFDEDHDFQGLNFVVRDLKNIFVLTQSSGLLFLQLDHDRA